MITLTLTPNPTSVKGDDNFNPTPNPTSKGEMITFFSKHHL
jgi:hypothetical protein